MYHPFKFFLEIFLKLLRITVAYLDQCFLILIQLFCQIFFLCILIVQPSMLADHLNGTYCHAMPTLGMQCYAGPLGSKKIQNEKELVKMHQPFSSLLLCSILSSVTAFMVRWVVLMFSWEVKRLQVLKAYTQLVSSKIWNGLFGSAWDKPGSVPLEFDTKDTTMPRSVPLVFHVAGVGLKWFNS